MNKKYLLAPGPTPVPPEVLQAMAMPIIHHRAPDFVPIMQSARDGLRWLYQTSNEVMMLSSSGTGAMVAAVNNFFSQGDKVLVINGGKFGERWGKIGKTYGLAVEEIVVEWGHSVDPAEVTGRLKADPSIKAVMFQASETSTGVYHDVEQVAKAVRANSGALVIVDAISGLVAHDLRMDEWGIDVMVAGAQKGLMLPPGLAFIAASERAWEANEKSTAPRFYFDLAKERKKHQDNQTNFTSAVTLIIGLNTALGMMREEGLENVFKRHALLAHATREAVKALGLELYAKGTPSNSLTAIMTPKGVDGQEMYKTLRSKYGITGAGGQDQAKGKIFRIAHLGYADIFDVITAISGIEMALRTLGHDVKFGTGVARAQEILVR